jgi:putative ABC transport system permease protein
VRGSMIHNYLKTTLRTLARRKGYSFINIAGLSVGLACCLMIFQFVAFEYSFDRFHENERDLYRLTQSTPLESEEWGEGGAFTGYALAPALIETVPEILRAARLHPEYDSAVVSSPKRPDRVFEEDRAFYADPAFLKMFSFPLVSGDAETALASGTILLSETAARKYFGPAEPVGEVLAVAGQIDKSYRVAGVFRDVPANSHLEFDVLMPMDDLVEEGYREEPEGGWSWNNFITYVQLRPGADRAEAERKMTEAYQSRRGEMLRQQGRKARLWAQPLRDIHLNAGISGPRAVMGSYRTVYFFTLIGLVTLLIALVNYVNLSTARALDRAREVGLRKTVGAQRRQLILQFLAESAVINLAAAGLAILLVTFLGPVVTGLAELRHGGALWTNPRFWAAFLATLGFATLAAGLYPAVVLSSFKPAAVLKGKIGSFGTQLRLRSGLVVLQFAASVVLIGGTAIVYDQLRYMRHMDLGLKLEQVLTVNGPRVLREGTGRAAAIAAFTEELRRLPAVRQVASSSSLPGQGFNWNGAAVRRAAADPSSVIRGVVTYIDRGFAALYGLELAAGSGFADITVPAGEDVPWPLIANETAVQSLGFETPDAAVGQALDLGGRQARIIGVFRDFNWSSAHEARQNIFVGYSEGGRNISLRVDARDLPGTIAAVETIHRRLFPGNVFRYAFADEAFDRQYRDDERFAALFTLFAALAITIACLGLFGLASFSTQQRTKEIGVRKILGASVPGLVGLLSRDFLKLVLAGMVIGSPVTYLLMRRWLERFAYHIDIGPAPFAFVGAVALLAALLTVSFQSVRAALADPVRSLRYE